MNWQIGFLLGAFSGFIAQYYGQIGVDRYRRKAEEAVRRKYFQEFRQNYANMYDALREDLREPGWTAMTRFYLYPATLGLGRKSLTYTGSDGHGGADYLADKGLARFDSDGDDQWYVMSPELIKFLKED